MKRFSMMAVGLLAFGWTAAHAETTAKSNTGPVATPPAASGDVATPPGTNGDVPAGTTTPTEVEVVPPGAPENKAVSPSPAVPGAAQTPPPANVNVDVNPTPPVVAPPGPVAGAPTVRPPAHIIQSNTAAITGGVTVPVAPVGPGPFFTPRQTEVTPLEHTWVARVGAGILVGGGFEDFTNNTMRNMTGTGGNWTARVLAGTRQFVGLEAGYVGSVRSIDALGLQSNATLLSNGLEGAARLNVPVVMRRTQLLEPFGFVGLGWSRYQLQNTTTITADLERRDDVMTLPVGGGLEYAIGRFMADARFTYRATYYNDLMRNGGNLNTWGLAGQVGFSF
jgi:hypothetical protein